MSQTNTVAIDFGTTNSKVARIDPRTGEAEVLPGANNEDMTPSVVYYGEGETLVGRAAES
jgi:molecular chaperone DnaK